MRKLLVSICLMLLMLPIFSVYAASLLVYDMGNGQIQTALTDLGYTYDVRSASNPVTLTDLGTHKAFVVGWNEFGDPSGLSILSSLPPGSAPSNAIITGHDPDFHAIYGEEKAPAASTFLDNCVKFVLSGSGYGFLALADYGTSHSYLPSWTGIVSDTSINGEDIASITASGYASGVYNGLTTTDLSDWGLSYHNGFTAYNPAFQPWELNNAGQAVTIAYGSSVPPVPIPAAVWLFGSGILGLIGIRRKMAS